MKYLLYLYKTLICFKFIKISLLKIYLERERPYLISFVNDAIKEL